MSFFDILKGSLATLRANKLRTLLTMLGIIIGISSVIAMWAIGNGGRDSILGDLKTAAAVSARREWCTVRCARKILSA